MQSERVLLMTWMNAKDNCQKRRGCKVEDSNCRFVLGCLVGFGVWRHVRTNKYPTSSYVGNGSGLRVEDGYGVAEKHAWVRLGS